MEKLSLKQLAETIRDEHSCDIFNARDFFEENKDLFSDDERAHYERMINTIDVLTNTGIFNPEYRSFLNEGIKVVKRLQEIDESLSQSQNHEVADLQRRIAEQLSDGMQETSLADLMDQKRAAYESMIESNKNVHAHKQFIGKLCTLMARARSNEQGSDAAHQK